MSEKYHKIELEDIIEEITKYKFQIIVLLLFLVFYHKVEDLLDTILVNPLLSKVDRSILMDVTFFLSSFLIISYFFYLLWKRIIISYSLFVWLSVLTIIYIVERGSNTKFTFIKLQSIPSIAYSDIILVIAISIGLYVILNPDSLKPAYDWLQKEGKLKKQVIK